jgi:2-oxo-4-hydroxy-4-carboxy-5-ureidoimidazoline decarboxylase
MTIADLDESNETEVGPSLIECCGSSNWVKRVLAERPYRTPERLAAAATDTWWRLSSADWLEAFSKHPQIGEKGRVSHWSAQEQSAMNSAAAQVASRLADLNRVYFDKFGWIFIVCATGKSAEDMLTLLETRLPNTPEDEIRVAAAEQNKITLLRLQKLLA